MKKYCFACVILNRILRVISRETGVSTRGKIETCSKFDFFIKEKKPRFTHWSEIFV